MTPSHDYQGEDQVNHSTGAVFHAKAARDVGEFR
jgi:hypothetical protein